MKDEELRILVGHAHNGDTEALSRLLVVFRPLHEAMLKKNPSLGVDRDDVAQQANLIIMLSILSYDPDKGQSPLLHITSKSHNDMTKFTKKENTEYKRTVPVGHLNDDEGPIIESYESEHVDSMLVNEILASLPHKDREAVELKFYDGLSDVDIAKRLGVTQGAVDKMIWKSLRKLHSALSEDATD